MEINKDPCAKACKPRGRPLSFDREQALEQAMHVFWRRGYEAASISELTAAMGITAPSLYTAFGDKERLFLEAIERYASGPGGGYMRALREEPSAFLAIQRCLEESAEELTRPCHPKGCMMTMAATNCTEASAHIQAALSKRRAEADEGMRCRIEQGITSGELPAGTDAVALSNFYVAVLRGMSMQAADGASRETLMATAAAAMRAWPAPG
ncbi:TetR/AcrR family transcriptional regulator [Paucibacter sediminis]|uniref:TetR/AcrR family transcriptional regulator n=1 Tax=Paucibacter sediminis TaxID=3019553 RepID=A0AA95NCK5_9BURK|nr:TetR/AcrR family transcriptional regulator [Paucibacter sp. S2-9]WIT12552.1 TetR/AcrR family transcriptional regulator [Paucibacter sp. S2-9]